MTTPIPPSLSEALAVLKREEDWAKKFMGEDMYKMYLALKDYEAETESKKDERERKLALMDYF